MKAIKIAELKDFSLKALQKAGVPAENAQIITEVLVATDTFGVLSHGTKNLYQYIQKMQAGGLCAEAEPEVVAEGPAWAIVDGHAAAGMVSSYKAMKLAVEKAKKTGIAYVGVRDSCHFGAAGYYANMAAQEGLIGIAMSNADPNMAIPNSSGVAIGNNPFSFAIPYKDGKTIFLDMALSNVAALKVVMAREKGIQVPPGWLVDKDGVPTNDPSGFPKESFLLPVGSHKGYGLAMMVETLASVITFAGILGQVHSWNLDMESRNNAGHAFIAVDASQMLSQEIFMERICQMVDELKARPKAKGAEQIFVPGEMEWEKREKALESGVLELTDAMADNMIQLSKLTGIEFSWAE